MSELPLTKLRSHFKLSFEQVVIETPFQTYLNELKVSAPCLHALLVQLHDFYPLTLGLEGESYSPTYLAIEACMKADTERTYPLETEAAARDYLMPFLHVYFDFLVYSRKSVTDKMPTRWDCTEQRLEDWSMQNGVRLAYLARTRFTNPCVLSDYERGVLVAKAAFGALLSQQVHSASISEHSGASSEVFELAFLKQSPYNVRKQVDRASMTHSGIGHVCSSLYQHFGVIPINGGSFTDKVVVGALRAWNTSLSINNIPVAYRDFVDFILESLNELFCARIIGFTQDTNQAWVPHGQSLREWSERLDIEKVEIEWGVSTKTNFELVQYRISIMRVLLRRVDLTLWGVPLPGDADVDMAI